MAGMSRARLGIFGGTFDPPHLGHLILAAECQAQLGLRKVIFVPTADPPHKRGRQFAPVADRLAMVESAIRDQEIFELSRVEIDRPGPHFALDTMKLLASRYAGNDLVYLIGGDSLRDLPEWNRPQEFIAACSAIGVMRRPRTRIDISQLESKLPGLSAKLEFVEAPLLEISSTEIRQRVREGGHYRYYLPNAVYEIIQERKLYR
jgi:nicotinate-nucleotide adenylyltransferase